MQRAQAKATSGTPTIVTRMSAGIGNPENAGSTRLVLYAYKADGSRIESTGVELAPGDTVGQFPDRDVDVADADAVGFEVSPNDKGTAVLDYDMPIC
jgi:hypothetical protein